MRKEKKKRKPLPFWVQIMLILICGAIIGGAVYGTIRYVKWRQYEDSLPVYTVTFAYQDGTVIETKQVKRYAKGMPEEIKELHMIVLMDEPEISLNISWQKSFVSDLMQIMELNPIRILMATHSPSIVRNYWDNTVELSPES